MIPLSIKLTAWILLTFHLLALFAALAHAPYRATVERPTWRFHACPEDQTDRSECGLTKVLQTP